MAEFCIIPELAEKLKQAAIRDEINIADMYQMTSKDRRELFGKYADKETARQINAGFEKAMIAPQQDALKRWAEATFNAEGKKTTRYKDVLQKINDLEKDGVLTPENTDAFLEDLVAKKLGAAVTAGEAEIIYKKTKRVQDAQNLPLNEFGLPQLEYWSAKKDLDDYLDSLVPNSNLKVLSSIIRRGSMLFSIKSPVVNIESNLVNAIGEIATRRLEGMVQGGVLSKVQANNVRNYRKYARNVFNKTGFDVTRMMGFDDGRKNLGEERSHSQGKGVVRKAGRFYQDVVFDKLMTAPDVAFAAFHFADSASLKATAVAHAEGKRGEAAQQRADEIFLDATRIDPQTPEGQQVRNKAIADAQFGTYTNDSQIAKAALQIRTALNTWQPDLRIGDQLMPFVETPANVVAATIDYSGVGLPFEIVKRSAEAWNGKSRGDADAFRKAFDRTFFRKVVRAGIGMSVALLLSQWFDPEDFIGEYPTSKKEQELLDLGNATTNSVRIGNMWISLDYLGPLGAPFVGFMTAKKYAKSEPEAALRYVLGGATQLARTPGFKQFRDLYEAMQKNFPDRVDPEKIQQSATSYAVDYVRSFIPAIIKDVAKGSDTYQREVDKTNIQEQFIQDMPWLRQGLPEKTNIFGEFKQGEGLLSTVFFGSRVKTATNDPVVSELERLASTKNLPSITDVSETSPRAKELKQQIGETEFRKAMIEFGQNFKGGIKELLEDGEYQEVKDDEKKQMIDKVKSELFEDMLLEYNYEPKEDE